MDCNTSGVYTPNLYVLSFFSPGNVEKICELIFQMTKMILKLFRFIKLSIKQALTGGFVALALVALLMLSVPHMAGAKEESEAVNALTSLEQMADRKSVV